MAAPLGLIAGAGDLPLIIVRSNTAGGRPVVAVTFDRQSFEKLSEEDAKVSQVGLGQASKVIRIFQEAGVTEVAFAGKVDKRVIYKNPRFDLRALSMLRRIKNKSDDSIMLAVVEELEKEGMRVASQHDILSGLFPVAGTLSKRKPNAKELKDIEFGMKMAKGIAALDIGQTVVVKDGAVVAVEAIDGTDETILRGGKIAGPGTVVCKVSKPRQDPRFDVPTVGKGTVEAMASTGAAALAIEAGATMVVDLENVAGLCGQSKIAFLAI